MPNKVQIATLIVASITLIVATLRLMLTLQQ